jgi:hypothetical protein
MARQRSFRVSAINIRAHRRHHADEYVELWKMWVRKKLIVRRGVFGLMIGDWRWLDKDRAPGVITGTLYHFVNIDQDQPWFDIEQKVPVDGSEVEEKVKIPAAFKPELRSVYYLFDTKKHRLYFPVAGQNGHISGGQVLKLLEILSSFNDIKERFGDVQFTQLTEQGAIDKFWHWQRLSRIEIMLERPNPDEYEDEQEVADRFGRMGVGREHRIYTKAEGVGTIEPDDNLRQVAGIAADNGYVVVKGLNPEGKADEASSKKFPRSEPGHYDPNTQTFFDAFVELIRDKF